MHKINTPEELLNYMSNNINYGYLGKNGHVYHFGENNFDNNWYKEYILEDFDDLKKNLYGNCWDQVEFERKWFLENNYEVKTIFEMVLLDYKNNYPSHSFLIYKDLNNKWNWFENSDFNNRGIHTFEHYDDLINYQYNCYIKYLKEFNIKDTEIKKIIMTEFTKPNSHISSNEYLNHVTKSKIIKRGE